MSELGNKDTEENIEELLPEDIELLESASTRDFKKVLVVDDILYVVKSISKILRDEGFFVITAMSGVEAIQKYENFIPDLVTIDQKLPDMTGFHLAEKLKKLDKSNKTKFIFISAVYEKDIIKSVLHLGIDSYLIKPFQRSKLLETVKSLIGDKGIDEETTI